MIVKAINDINVRVIDAEDKAFIGKFLLCPNSVRRDIKMGFVYNGERPSDTPWVWDEDEQRFEPSKSDKDRKKVQARKKEDEVAMAIASMVLASLAPA